MTRDQTPGTNLRLSHIHVLLTSLGQHVPLKINVGFAKVWRKKFFSGEDGVFHMKEFRTTLTFIYIYMHFLTQLSKFAKVQFMLIWFPPITAFCAVAFLMLGHNSWLWWSLGRAHRVGSSDSDFETQSSESDTS